MTRLLGVYLNRLHAAAANDAHLSSAFIRVAGLVAPPRLLLRPDMTLRVLLSRGAGRPPVVSATNASPFRQSNAA